MDAAARFLETRSRSVAETRRRLTDAGYPPPLIEEVVAHLVELGYLDDAAFARAWVESRDRAHPRGEAALRRELALKGIDREVAEAALEERRTSGGPDGRAGGGSWIPGSGPGAGPATGRGLSTAHARAEATLDPDDVAARRVLDRRSAVLLREPDLRRRRAKAYALLARHGFDPGTCRAATEAWIAGSTSGPDPDRDDV